MRKVKLTVTLWVTDELFESKNVQGLKHDMLTGKFQSEIKESWDNKVENGVIKVLATFETIK